VVAAGPLGAYAHLVLADPVLAQAAPGQFVAVGGGGPAGLDAAAAGVQRAPGRPGRRHPGARRRRPRRRDGVDRRPQGRRRARRRGPARHAVRAAAADGRVVLVGGGYGSAPFAWTARAAVAAGLRVDAVVGAGDAGRLCDVDGVRRVVEPAGGRLLVTTDDGSAGERGRVTDALAVLLADGDERRTTVLACGPMAMLAAVARTAADASPGPGGRSRCRSPSRRPWRAASASA
jgi:dihydroorotate dehydrogenase electron transfer subunit